MMTERRLVSPVPSPFRQQYALHEELGRGSYAIVHRCIQSNTSQQYAVKVVDKTKANPSQLEDLKQEVGIMKELKHPNIISLKDIFDSELTLYIVMELVHGGDVFTVITKWTQYGESIAAEMLHNFISAIQYLHNNNIVHRDLKPDNILITQALPKSKTDLQQNPSLLTDIKVADFGFSTHCGPIDDLKKCCGTPYYIAPEILNCGLYKTGPPYGKQCDMWSVGVIAYVIISGAPPFQAQKRHQLFKIIVKGKFAFTGSVWDGISEGAKDFIRGLLVLDPKQRMTPAQALAHPWIRNRSRSISQTVLPKVQTRSDFKPKQKFKAGVICIVAIHRLVYLQKKKEDAPQKKSLKKLVLRNNEIETTSLDTIVHTLARHPSITHLDLSHHPLSKHSAKKILYVLQVNPYIRKVEVDGNVVQANRIKSVESLMQTGPAAANANMALPAIATRSQ